MFVTPGKHDLQERMQVGEGHLAPDKYPTPDERTNAPEDDAELVNAEWCISCRHTLRVAQRIVPLKGSPRYLTLSYTESFFLTFSVLAYTAFRQQRFLAGGIWSGLASATRLPGILLGVPLLFAAFLYLKGHRRWWPVIVAGLLVMSGILAFLFYLWAAFGDPLATFRVQQQAPGWQREFAFPFRSIKAGLKQTLSSHFSPAPVDAWLALLFMALACALPLYLSTSYAVYSLLCLALPLCTTAGIWSFSRYASVIFPVFMLLGIVGQRSRWRVWGLVAMFGILLVILSMRYAQWHWVA
jgi:Gpi18-like mannosyltransferase